MGIEAGDPDHDPEPDQYAGQYCRYSDAGVCRAIGHGGLVPGNQYTFVLFCIYFGIATATSVMCAQYWGKGDRSTIERVIGLSARVAILASALFTLISFFFPEKIMQIFTDSPETIVFGSTYLKVLSVFFVFNAISQAYISSLRSVGKIPN